MNRTACGGCKYPAHSYIPDWRRFPGVRSSFWKPLSGAYIDVRQAFWLKRLDSIHLVLGTLRLKFSCALAILAVNNVFQFITVYCPAAILPQQGYVLPNRSSKCFGS